MKSSTAAKFSGASVLAFLAMAAAPALAQDGAPAEEAVPGDEIVVTAQFRQQNLQDTPLAITAVNAAMLEARGQTSVEQVAEELSNRHNNLLR